MATNRCKCSSAVVVAVVFAVECKGLPPVLTWIVVRVIVDLAQLRRSCLLRVLRDLLLDAFLMSEGIAKWL